MKNNVFLYIIIILIVSFGLILRLIMVKVEKTVAILERKEVETNMKYLSKIDDEKVINETVFTKIDNSILINPNTLYLRLHNDICMECFEASINELIQIAKNNGVEFSVLGSFKREEDFKNILLKLNLEKNVCKNCFYLDDFKLLDERRKPYLFYLKNDIIFYLAFLDMDTYNSKEIIQISIDNMKKKQIFFESVY